jgi:hypothetical protein
MKIDDEREKPRQAEMKTRIGLMELGKWGTTNGMQRKRPVIVKERVIINTSDSVLVELYHIITYVCNSDSVVIHCRLTWGSTLQLEVPS